MMVRAWEFEIQWFVMKMQNYDFHIIELKVLERKICVMVLMQRYNADETNFHMKRENK